MKEEETTEHKIEEILTRNFDNGKYLWSKAHTELKEMCREIYDQGHQDGASDQRMGDQEFLERLKLEVDTVICDCGEPYKDSDLADLINERLTPPEITLTSNK